MILVQCLMNFMMLSANITLSLYEMKSHYSIKMRIIGGVDPFCISTLEYLKLSDDYTPADTQPKLTV